MGRKSKTKISSSPSITVIDIGARGGASSEWLRIGNSINLIGFEPDDRVCKKLNNQQKKSGFRQIYYPYAIAGTNGIRNFYITRRKTVSSLYRPINSEWKKYGIPGSDRNRRAEVSETIKVKAITLDSFCKKHKITPDFIKIDTQGSELEIIKEGFDKNLDSVIGMEIEVEFVPLYHGQLLFSETELYLRNKGFELVGMKRHMWKMNDGKTIKTSKGGRLVFADALFIHRAVLNNRLSQEQSIKAALIAHRYELFDIRDLVLRKNHIKNSVFEAILSKARIKKQIGFSKILNMIRNINKALKTSEKNIVGFDEKYGI